MCSAEFVLTALNKQLFWDQTNISPLFIEEKKKVVTHLVLLVLLFNNVQVEM